MAEGRQVTSSQELGDRLGISSAQIRKDLSHFGEFGKQGTGYDIAYLYDQLRVTGTAGILAGRVEAVEEHRALPEAVRAAIG
jgi:DeoR/GlpR family transcriptional regulator of sugar metabolism